MSNVNVIYILVETASSSVSPVTATMDPNYCSNHFLAERAVSDRVKYYPSSSYSLSGSRRRCPDLPLLHTISDWQTVGLQRLLLHRTRPHNDFRKEKVAEVCIQFSDHKLYAFNLYSTGGMSQTSGRQATVSAICTWSIGHTVGDSQHIICSLLIILCCLSNKEGQCDTHIVYLFQTATGPKGDVEYLQKLMACLSIHL